MRRRVSGWGGGQKSKAKQAMADAQEVFDADIAVDEGPDPTRTVRFGTSSDYVSNPRKTARDRAAYIARHRVNENHGDPLTPGALSRWLLWGESRSLARNTAAFRRRFRLQ